jgi:hypothetical protein
MGDHVQPDCAPPTDNRPGRPHANGPTDCYTTREMPFGVVWRGARSCPRSIDLGGVRSGLDDSYLAAGAGSGGESAVGGKKGAAEYLCQPDEGGVIRRHVGS